MRPYSQLVAELINDPLNRDYSGMTNQQVAESLNTIDRTYDVLSVSGQDIFEAATLGDQQALSPDDMTLFLAICAMGTILVNGENTKTVLLTVFGPGTDTRDNLARLQKEDISRATEIGWNVVTDGHIGSARIKMGS